MPPPCSATCAAPALPHTILGFWPAPDLHSVPCHLGLYLDSDIDCWRDPSDKLEGYDVVLQVRGCTTASPPRWVLHGGRLGGSCTAGLQLPRWHALGRRLSPVTARRKSSPVLFLNAGIFRGGGAAERSHGQRAWRAAVAHDLGGHAQEDGDSCWHDGGAATVGGCEK